MLQHQSSSSTIISSHKSCKYIYYKLVWLYLSYYSHFLITIEHRKYYSYFSIALIVSTISIVSLISIRQSLSNLAKLYLYDFERRVSLSRSRNQSILRYSSFIKLVISNRYRDVEIELYSIIDKRHHRSSILSISILLNLSTT